MRIQAVLCLLLAASAGAVTEENRDGDDETVEIVTASTPVDDEESTGPFQVGSPSS